MVKNEKKNVLFGVTECKMNTVPFRVVFNLTCIKINWVYYTFEYRMTHYKKMT